MAAGTRLLSKIEDMKAPVFKALLHYVYTDKLPAEEGDADHKALTCLTSLLWYWYRQLQKSWNTIILNEQLSKLTVNQFR